MKLSIIIVNWNVKDMLQQCLTSVFQHPVAGDFEVWVVDNASTDNSLDMLKQKFPQVRLIQNEINVGFATANNQALEKSTGQYALLLNPDTEVRPGALDSLVTFLDAHPQAGASGAMLLNPDGTHQADCFPFPTLMREFWRLLHLDMLIPTGIYNQSQWDRKQPRQVDVIQGTALALRRNALETVGVLDTDYFMYTEEVDLCFRLQQAGWQLYWVPQAQVIHYGGQSTQQIAATMFLHLYRSKVLFFRKHYGKLSANIYKLILGITSLPRLLLIPLAKFQSGAQRQQNLTLASNYQQLIKSLPEM